MKLSQIFLRSARAGIVARCHGLTLVEMMITMSIFGLVVAGFISLQLFGLRQSQLVESKLGASDQSRVLLEKMGSEIRSAKTWYVGSMSGTTFTPVTDGQPQIGTALRVFNSSNTNAWITYYFNTGAGTLLRAQSGVAGVRTVAEDLTNSMTFQAENFQGVVQTNRAWRNCIRVILEFAQFQYPLTKVGPGYLYDYYKIEYKVSPHCPTLP